MQNHESKKTNDDVSVAKLHQLINAIKLLKRMMKKQEEAKMMMMARNPFSYYTEICHPFSNN